jgi:perosamine synthetase
VFTPEVSRRYTEGDVEAVAAVLRHGSLSVVFGRQTMRFEREFARYTGTAHAVATSSGTAALEIGLDLLDVGFGDEVVLPGYTFTAAVLAVLRNLATPVFADIDPGTWNVSIDTVAAALTERTRAVLVAHMFGAPADIAPIAELCRERGIALVEDCAQAAGAVVGRRRVGSFGALGAFSFNEIKNLTTGEGGMITLDDRDLAERARVLRLQGTRNLMGDELGTKATMTEMEAALGRSQLARLDTENAARTSFGTRLAKLLADVPGLGVQRPPADAEHVYSRFVFCTDPTATGITRDEVAARLAPTGLTVRPVYACPLYRQPVVARLAEETASTGFARSYLQAYASYGGDNPLRRWRTETLPVVERFCDQQLGFVVPPGVTDRHADRIAAELVGVLTSGPSGGTA